MKPAERNDKKERIKRNDEELKYGIWGALNIGSQVNTFSYEYNDFGDNCRILVTKRVLTEIMTWMDVAEKQSDMSPK